MRNPWIPIGLTLVALHTVAGQAPANVPARGVTTGVGVSHGGVGVELLQRPTSRVGVGLGAGVLGANARLVGYVGSVGASNGGRWWLTASANANYGTSPRGGISTGFGYGPELGVQYWGPHHMAEVGVSRLRSHVGQNHVLATVAFGWPWP